MRRSRLHGFCLRAGAVALLLMMCLLWGDEPVTAAPPGDTAIGTETIVFFRHGENPAQSFGQLTPQGLNRALALVTVMPKKFGKPDYLFAPDPQQMVTDGAVPYNYVRPLATIEPLAIALEMPVHTPCGFSQVERLEDELLQPAYSKAIVFVCWEHGFETHAVADLLKEFGDTEAVPKWVEDDFDTVYIVTITRAADRPSTATFKIDHEGLNGLSTAMPGPAMAAAKN